MSLTRQPSWVYTLIAVLPVIAYVMAPTISDFGLRVAVGGTALLWMVAFSLYAWVRLDEPSREAHKFAWFWGGAPALVVIQLIAVGAVTSPIIGEPIAAFVASQARSAATPEAGFFVGVFSAAIVQVAGYGLVWIGWWLSKRSRG
jgi:hypothetical protein